MHYISVVKNKRMDKKNIVKKILDWPPNSPDLNLIENVWGIIKGELKKENISKRRILINRILRDL